MSGNTISTSETKIEALQLQSSAYGVTVPLLYGVNRIAGNMIWYGGFKAIANTTTQSGKGGGTTTQNTTFAYSASVMMALCEGQITGIGRGWKGKKLVAGGPTPVQIVTVSEAYTVPAAGGVFTATNAATYAANVGVMGPPNAQDYSEVTLSEGADYSRVGGVYTFNAIAGGVALSVTVTYQYTTGGASQTALQAMGLSFASGAIGQPVWSVLNTYTPPGGTIGSQAIGYSGLAYVYAQDYALGTGAQVENHSFEIQGPQAYSISTTIPDANPCLVAMDVLINGRYGAAFPRAQLGIITPWSNYCLASGLLFSPAITEQMQAGEFAALMGRLTNTALVWSAGKLKMIPYGDVSLTANGATYTPSVTPIYDLADDDFIGTGDPIRIPRKPQADAYNHIRIEFSNRANLYNIEIAEAKDSANIDIFGLRSAEILRAHWVCDPAIARTVAQLLLQRALYIRNTYEFTLPWTRALLEPMDLVTLTDAALGLNNRAVRIIEITESDNDDLSVIAEDFPIGIANAALYTTQAGVGYQHDYNASPGSISAPVIFEAPGALTQNGLELYVAATGTGAAWGGCHVYVSLDGTTYRQVGTINGGSRYGTLSAACGASGTVPVALLTGALTSGSVADAAALNTLAYIGGAANEFFSFNTATLTSALHYDLAGTPTRGAYGTTAASHASGDKFVRVDTSVAKSGPIDLGYVGKTVHVKCTSFNLYGAAGESLAAVTDYTYTVTGAQVLGNAGAQAYSSTVAAASDNILSAGEKPPEILKVNTINSEQAGLDAQATAYAVTTEKTTYDSAVATLVVYLATLTTPTLWSNTAGDTTIAGTTYRANFLAVYVAKQALVNKLSAAAGLVATWAGIPAGSGKAADNATVGATWGNNLTGQPADSALLNAMQTWAQVSGAGRPADNATANQSDATTNNAIAAAQTAANNAQTTANTANTAITSAFSVNAVSDIGGTATSGSPKFLGSRTASPSGGTAPYKYQWVIGSQGNVPASRVISLTGASTATVNVNISSFASGNEANAELACIISDANNRMVNATLSVGVLGI